MHVKPSFLRARQAPKPSKWTSDHTGQGGKSSMGVLLDWLATQGNYERWRRCARVGESSRPLADEIVRLLQAEGLTNRSAHEVQSKMAELEQSYREAAERLASAKREVQAAQGTPAERNLRRVLERHCRYFALLQPIMKDMGDMVAESPVAKRPKLSTKRKTAPVVKQSVPAVSAVSVAAAPASPPPARAASPPPARFRSPSPPPAKKRPRYQLRERREAEDLAWDFDNESVGGIRSPGTPPTPSTTRPVRKSKSRAMASMSGMHMEEEEGDRGHARRQRRNILPDPVKKRQSPMLRSIDEIDLEKARVELTLRQLELQMARDKALVTRAKARAQLLEQGVSRREVDRLMPLDV